MSQREDLTSRSATTVEPEASTDENAVFDAEVQGLRERVKVLESENWHFAEMFVQVQDQNEAMTNLYVVSQRIHGSLNKEEVTKSLTEILAELVGAEVFGVFLVDENQGNLELIVDEGASSRLPSTRLVVGEGIIGEVADSGEAFFFDMTKGRSKDPRIPIATVPLRWNDSVLGVIVIYEFLSHKSDLSSLDHQLLDLLATSAASAYVSARLHAALGRKLKTVEDFLHLMKGK